MDRKSRRSVAVTAGLAAVLALSPVVAPAVTAQAQDGDSTRMEQSTETISITFVYCDGTDESEVRTYDKGNKIINNKPTLEREGYKFGGWYSDPEYSESSKLDIRTATATVDMTLYAKWNKNPTLTFYNEISYENMDGVDAYLVDVPEYDDSYPKPDNPTLPDGADGKNYIFDGWFTDPSLDEQYKFSDWNSGFTEDTTLYAKWTKFPTVAYYLSPDSNEACYEVEVDLNAGPDDRQKPLLKSAVTEHLGDTIPEGYAIEGFYTDPDYTNKFTEFAYVDEDTTLYIKFDKQPVVTFDFNYDDVSNVQQSVNLFDYADAPEHSREGYELVGWYTDADCTEGNEYSFDIPVTGDMTLYAKWAEIQYAQVTFDYNAPDGDDTTTEVKVGDPVTKPATDPSRIGYDFAGWYTDKDCTEAYDFATPVTDNMTLYAKWTPVVDPDPEPTPDPDPEPTPDPDPEPTPDPEPEPTPDPEPETKTFSVTLNDGLAGTEDQVITIAEGETIDSSAIKVPTYDGWTFVGWFTDSDLTQEWDFSTPVTSDMTLWAGWLRNDVDGSGVTDDTETTTDDVEKDANKAEKDNDPAVPDTGDATVSVSGIAAVGAALTGAGALIRRRR